MKLELLRFSSGKDSTLGILSETTMGRRFLCYTLEDEFRAVKVKKETRIPAGEYQIKLRTEGGFHQNYSKKYPSIHKGMLHLQNVPGFEYILIHVGNTDDNTEGCILVGDTSSQNIIKDGFIGESGPAYTRIYPPIASALLRGEMVTIKVVDFDTVKM